MTRATAAIGALTLALTLMSGSALADSSVSSRSQISDNDTGVGQVDAGYQDSSSVSLNGDSISSFMTVADGDVVNMGLAYDANADAFPGLAESQLGSGWTLDEDSWYLTCASGFSCEAVTSPIPVTLIATIAGTVSAAPSVTNDNQGGIFGASYGYENYGPPPTNLGFGLTIYQSSDPEDQNSDSVPGLSGVFDYCAPSESGSCVDEQEPVKFTPIGDGNYSFSVTYDESGDACTVDSSSYCQISARSCAKGEDCPSEPMFVSYQEIEASFGAGYTGFVDALDPFSVEFVSDDPDYQFVSDNGLLSGSESAPSTPEPGSLGILAAGLGLLTLALWRRRFTARAADDGAVRLAAAAMLALPLLWL
ncbi:MAG: PEP-CTERM sorting domain-containing protein [Steroidobacteraceae bacterium]